MPLMQKALDTGSSDLATAYDYKGGITQRTEVRKARLKGDIALTLSLLATKNSMVLCSEEDGVSQSLACTWPHQSW
jgi:hypothetical protein